jgi:hypothetical protein
MSPLTVLGAVLAQADQVDAYGNPNEWGYVLFGWAAAIVGIALYAVLVLRKGRQLSKQVPPEDRRWMS